MKELFWKIRYTFWMAKRIQTYNLSFCWMNAGVTYTEVDDATRYPPKHQVDEDLSYWND